LEEHRPLVAAVLLGPGHGEPAALGERAEEGAGVRARAIAGIHAVDGEALGRMLGEETLDVGGERPLFGGAREVQGGFGRKPIWARGGRSSQPARWRRSAPSRFPGGAGRTPATRVSAPFAGGARARRRGARSVPVAAS